LFWSEFRTKILYLGKIFEERSADVDDDEFISFEIGY